MSERVGDLSPARLHFTGRGGQEQVTDHQVAIIGAGPYGLASAARLRGAGVDTHVFGEEMSYWRRMPRGMQLRSPYQASSMSDSRGPVGLPAYEAEARA